MSVLDAIMIIITDLLGFGNLTGDPANMLVGGLRGFIEGIIRVVEFFQMLFAMAA